MELSQSLTLNEEIVKELPEAKRPVFVYEWLQFLEKVLVAAQKCDVKGCQKKLVTQLLDVMQDHPGPPVRKLVGCCLATLFNVGDTFLLFDTVNKCNDIVKNRDDSPGSTQTKLAAICSVGYMYQKLGRMMGRSYEETVQVLIKSLKNADSLTRMEIMTALEKICGGMGAAIAGTHKEIYKCARACLTDRVMSVRCAASKCLLEIANNAPFMYTTELENMVGSCFRGFDGANYETRLSVARLLGTLIAYTQRHPSSHGSQQKTNGKELALEDALGLLGSGFLRGGTGFLKGTGEIIKGTFTINRDVRVGVTYAYVVVVEVLGTSWMEKNLAFLFTHVLELAASPKATTSHIDAVYSRKCINFILRSTAGKMLSEKAQSSACRELALIVAKQMAAIESGKDSGQDGQHLLTCTLQEVSLLVLSLGTSSNSIISDHSSSLIEAVTAVLVHPCYAARLAAAWCLRCICVAVPSRCTILINRCIEALEVKKTVPEAISGYSVALSAVLGGVRLSPLGIPYLKGKVIFSVAEELLRSASQNSRLSLHRTQAGWLLIGAVMTLGSNVVRPLLPRMVLLWRNSFPRSSKELESEKGRGDAFTWQVTLEGRAGALSSISSFLLHCPELANEDIIRRLLTPIESAVSMLVNMSSVLKSYGQQVKAPAAMVRHRLYETLSLLPPEAFEGCYTHVLRLLVLELTLGDNPANAMCSQLRTAASQANEPLLLGLPFLAYNHHRMVEDQLLVNGVPGTGALEHDSCCLYRPLPPDKDLPGPLPLGVAVIDSSITLFGLIFPKITNKHRLQIFTHFTECVKQCKSSRAEAVTANLFAALLAAFKNLSEVKTSIGHADVQKAAVSFILNAITNSSPLIRCASAEALGRLAQVVADPKFTAELTQISFDRLKLARDVASRTGYSLALGCIHRYVGGMESSQHLNTSVSILLALAQDSTSPVVQVWSLYALFVIAESGGPMFRGYVDPTLTLSLKLLLTVPHSYVDIHHCVGQVLSALLTVIGPELQGNSAAVCDTRSAFLSCFSIMQRHQNAVVQADAVSCLQQLHLFAPRYVDLSLFVPTLCKKLHSGHLLLKKAVVSCLRQLTQREAKEVNEYALEFTNEAEYDEEYEASETGLPGVLFKMLDTEQDAQMEKDIHDSLNSMLQMLAAGNLTQWLSLCRRVLTVTTSDADDKSSGKMQSDEADDEGDDQLEFHAGDDGTKKGIQPRWPTRVFAASCIRRIITTCESFDSAHFDIVLAKELHMTKSEGDYLVLHLSELIRMAFIAATSDCDPLRLEGLQTLHVIIEKFSKVPEPEFPGHLLLEQFQAQVSAALRPAFSSDTASHVTAAACAVCSAWIGSGVAKDLNDLRRVHQLLVSSLDKLRNTSNSAALYNESVATLEKLSILKAWAEVYIVAMIDNGLAPGCHEFVDTGPAVPSSTTMEDDEFEDSDEEFGKFESKTESLLSLVQPELSSLAEYWLSGLRDHALLQLPPEYLSQLPPDGGAFFTSDTMDSCRPHYLTTWPSFLYAITLWLNVGEFRNIDLNTSDKEKLTEKFGLIFGICMEALCNYPITTSSDNAMTCLRSLYTLLDLPYPRSKLFSVSASLPVEVCSVLYRLILTTEEVKIQSYAMAVLKQTIKAAEESLEARKRAKLKELYPANQEKSLDALEELDMLGEGGEDGDLNHGKDFVFSVLEVCLCLLTKLLGGKINPDAGLHITQLQGCRQYPSADKHNLIASALICMEALPDLCSPAGAVAILPTILYLTTCCISETAVKVDNTSLANSSLTVTGAVRLLRSLSVHRYCSDRRTHTQWKALLQSTLAKLIDLVKTGSDDLKVDEIAMMMSLSVMVLHAPATVVAVPSLQYPCINFFKQCFQNGSIYVRLKCTQTLKRLFAHSDKSISGGYILAVAPRLVEYLHSKEPFNIQSEAELSLAMEIISTVEVLIHVAEPEQRGSVLVMLVPALVKLLLDESTVWSVNKYRRHLHECCLQWLKKIGPQYPQDFKGVMSQSPDLRSKLELAVKMSGKLQQRVKQEDKNASSITRQSSVTPTIKLKTDFSDFKS